MQNFISHGEKIDVISNQSLNPGDLLQKNNILSFIVTSCAPQTVVPLQTRGVFNALKDDSIIEQGQAVYYDPITNKLSASIAGNNYFGFSINSANENDDYIQVFYDAAIYASRLSPDESDVILVKSHDDLSGDLDPTKLYRTVGLIDMGDQSVIWPAGGLQISGPNGGRDISGLYSSADNYTMFISPEGGYSGNGIFDSCSFNVTGENSKIFENTNNQNNGAIDISKVNFGFGFGSKATSLGELTAFRQIFTSEVGFFVNDGLTFNGTWAGGATIRNTIALGFPANKTLFKEGLNLSMGRLRTDINFDSADPTATLSDFNPSNIIKDDGLAIDGATTTVNNPLPNFPSTSVKARIRNSSGFETTYVGGEIEFTTAILTPISAVNTPTKVLGATTATPGSLTHVSADNDNEIVSTSTQKYDVNVWAGVSVSGGNNKQINLFFRHTKTDNSFTDGKKFRRTLNGGLLGDRAEGFTIRASFKNYELGDKIELYGENITDNTDFTVLTGGSIVLGILPS